MEFRVHVADTAAKVHNEAKEDAPSGVTGMLKATIYMRPEEGGTAAWVGSPLAYAVPVEAGRKPGKMPPVAALERWGEIVLGERGLGWPLAVSIRKKGIPPQPFLTPAVEKHRQEFLDGARAILKRSVK